MNRLRIRREPSPPEPHLSSQVGRFAVVGVVATLTHYGAALVLVQTAGASPEIANVIGWLTAIGVSFLGHLRWTFAHSRVAHSRAALRFVLLSVGLFVSNAIALSWLMRQDLVSYRIALAITIAGQAALSFFLSRLWAFRQRNRISASEL